MASTRAEVALCVSFALLLLLAFYVGRPLYWKLSATFLEIREERQIIRQGISQFVVQAPRSVRGGRYHDESDSGALILGS